MERDIIIEIIDKFSAKNINKLKITDKDFSIELEKDGHSGEFTGQAEKIQAGEFPEGREFYQVKSPLVGLYYQAPGPDKDPFVQIGDFVEEGDSLYIVEAMKMINEISSPVSGIVKKIYFKDEDLVQYDDLVMEIDVDV